MVQQDLHKSVFNIQKCFGVTFFLERITDALALIYIYIFDTCYTQTTGNYNVTLTDKHLLYIHMWNCSFGLPK